MAVYLVDVNMPYYFSYWNSEEYIFQRDLDSCKSDKEIWEYAKANNLTIITKDSDFADRIVNQSPPPKVIHFKIGNMKLSQLHDFIGKHWNDIVDMNKIYKLINVYEDRIEGID
jgi:predicted nuclease of predicted toxin-antitoxin system